MSKLKWVGMLAWIVLAGLSALGAPLEESDIVGKVRTIELVWKDAESWPLGSEQRKKNLEEFLAGSEFVREMPSTHSATPGIWMLRAIACIELDRRREGWEAGDAMKALGLQSSKNELCQKAFVQLERNGLLDQRGNSELAQYDAQRKAGQTISAKVETQMMRVKANILELSKLEGEELQSEAGRKAYSDLETNLKGLGEDWRANPLLVNTGYAALGIAVSNPLYTARIGEELKRLDWSNSRDATVKMIGQKLEARGWLKEGLVQALEAQEAQKAKAEAQMLRKKEYPFDGNYTSNEATLSISTDETTGAITATMVRRGRSYSLVGIKKDAVMILSLGAARMEAQVWGESLSLTEGGKTITFNRDK